MSSNEANPDTLVDRTRRRQAALHYALPALVVFLLGVLALASLPLHVFWSPDEGIRYILSRLDARQGLPPGVGALPYPGRALDPQLAFFPSAFNTRFIMYPVPRPDGSLRLPWPLAFPWISGRLYELLGGPGLYLVPLLSGALSALLAGRLAARAGLALPAWAVLLAGLGTPLFFYSLLHWDHTLQVLVAMLALDLALCGQDRPARLWAGLGLAVLGAALLSPLLLILVAALLVAQLLPGVAPARRPPLARHAGLLLAAFGGAWVLFGGLPQRYATEAQRWLERLGETTLSDFAALASRLPYLWVNLPDVDSPPLPAWLAWAGVAAMLLIAASAWVKDWRFELLLLLPGLTLLAYISGSIAVLPAPYRALHGFLLPAPGLAFAAYALPASLRQFAARRQFVVPLSLAALAYAVLGSAWILLRSLGLPTHTAGLEWGTRYLLPLYPLLAVLALLSLQAYQASSRPAGVRALVSGLVVALLLLGVLFQARGFGMLRSTKLRLAALDGYLAAQTSGPLVTDVWWLPAALAGTFCERELYSLSNEAAVTEWLRAIASQPGRTAFTALSLRDEIFPPEQARLYGWTSQPRVYLHGVIITRYTREGGP